MQCFNCQREIPDHSVFCLVCGRQLTPAPGSAGPVAQSATPEWMTLCEYQLQEKVENRVWDSIRRQAKVGVLVFSVAGALLALFGGSVLLDYVTSKVKEGLQRDAKVLQDRIVAQSAEMSVVSAQLKIQADAADAEFNRMKQSAQNFKKLSDGFEDLRLRSESNSKKVDEFDKILTERVVQMQKDSERLGSLGAKLDKLSKASDELGLNVARVQSMAASAQVSTKSLGGGIVTSGLGGPAIISGPAFSVESGTLTGTNFGKAKGHLYMRVVQSDIISLGGKSTQKILEIPKVSQLSQDSIKQWDEGSIAYVLSPAVINIVKQTVAKLKADSGSQSRNLWLSLHAAQVEFQVETASGEKSNWYAIFYPEPLLLDDSVNIVAQR